MDDLLAYAPYAAGVLVLIGAIGLIWSRRGEPQKPTEELPCELVSDWRPTGKIDFARRDLNGKAESYTAAELAEQPTLADMTRAALTVLGSAPKQPFALFVEAGDVDFALHANNLDNAVGAVYSGEDAVRFVIQWVEAHSNWDDSLLLVSSDHGHYLVVDDPRALAGTR